MGKLYQGIDGPFTGKVGPVVGYLWKNRACIRSYQSHVNYPNTAEQQQQRSWFVGMVRFASEATAALRLGLARQAAEARMTEGNYFIQKNKQHFHRNGNTVETDYEKLQIAAGPATDVYFHKPRFEQGETVVVNFEKNALSFKASADDRIYLYIYTSALGKGLLSAPAARRDKQVSVRLPEEWAGQEVHLYGFVVDRDGRPSCSTYIGIGRVNHYEDRGRYIPLDNQWQEFVDLAKGSSDPVALAEAGAATPAEPPRTAGGNTGDPPEVP